MPHNTFAHVSTDATDTVIVNGRHPLAPSYRPADLVAPNVVTLILNNIDTPQLTRSAAAALSRMLDDGEDATGQTLVLSSGYRGYTEQQRLYEQARHYTPAALDTVAPPGESEHQTGLAADIISFPNFCPAQACFAMTRSAEWLWQSSYHYGFILRYPLYQEQSTGYAYEPWHYRYVGPELAQKMHESHQTLEQYYAHAPATLTP